MDKAIKTVAVITAAGSGNRLPGEVKKQFRLLGDKPVIIHTLQHFVTCREVDLLIITLPDEDRDYCQDLIQQYFPEQMDRQTIRLVTGGNHRQDSVFNALCACPDSTETVLIHDAVRPFITQQLIASLLREVKEYQAVIPADKVKNTVKQVSDGYVVCTPDRESLVQVYTPQVFYFPLIKECYLKALRDGYYATDDAALAEHYGHRVKVHYDANPNLKITDPFDLFVSEQLISHAYMNLLTRPQDDGDTRIKHE